MAVCARESPVIFDKVEFTTQKESFNFIFDLTEVEDKGGQTHWAGF